MLNYTIAGINITYSAAPHEIFDGKLKEYLNHDIGFAADVRIACKYCDEVVVPNERIAMVNSRVWVRRADGITIFNYNDQLEIFIAKIDIDSEWKNLRIQLLDTNKHLQLDDPCHRSNVVAELFRYIVLFHSGVVIHSSSIAYNGSGLLFSAMSGTGKSTHTGLWQKNYPQTEIINDDSPAIMMRDSEVLMCGTPFAGSTGININKTVPLKAIVFLRRGEINTIQKISPAEAIKYLIKEVRLPLTSELMDMALTHMGTVLSKVPAYLLHCTISDEAVEVVKKAVF